jgi:hypothetical protein
LSNVRIVRIDKMPPRRLGIVHARDVQLSMADQAVRDGVFRIVAARVEARPVAAKPVRSRVKRG